MKNARKHAERIAYEKMKNSGITFPSEQWADAYKEKVQEVTEYLEEQKRRDGSGFLVNQSWLIDSLSINRLPPASKPSRQEIELVLVLKEASYTTMAYPDDSYWPITNLRDMLSKAIDLARPPLLEGAALKGGNNGV